MVVWHPLASAAIPEEAMPLPATPNFRRCNFGSAGEKQQEK